MICSFFLGIMPAAAESTQPCRSLRQGEIIQIQFPGAETITVSKKVRPRIDEDGTFLYAAERDAAKEQEISVKYANGKTEKQTFKILPETWDIQNLKGVQPRKVTPKKEDEDAILKEQKLIRQALSENSPVANWKDGFMMPLEGRISGKFGGQRIMNGIKKNPHAGMDIAAPIGTEVKAAGSGLIILAETGLFYSGNVLIIDHGFGLHTIYAHLNDFTVRQGDFVKKGDIIAHVGKTGRVTGPHLHWGSSLQLTKFNPQSLLRLNNNNILCFNSKE